MADKGLNDLFKDTLRDVYYAEKQALKSLPKMERAANAEEVKQAFRTHLKQTEGQIERLEKVFGMIDLTRACSSRPSPRSPRPTTCSPRSRTPAPTRRRWRRPRVTADR